MAAHSPFSNALPEDMTELRPLSEETTSNERVPSQLYNHPWLQTFLRWGPLLGVASLGASLLCVGMALVVLVWSNGDKVSRWNIQPPVYLSITTAASNTLIRFALAQSLPVAWWRHAIRGDTIKALQKQWAAGGSIQHALTSGRSAGFVALACIAATLLVFDGPLLQRASTVISAVPDESMLLNLRIAPEVPTGFSGDAYPNEIVHNSHGVAAAFQGWVHKDPIIMNVTGCEGTCRAKIRAPGLAPTPGGCYVSTIHVNGYDLPEWPQWQTSSYLLFNTNLDVSFIDGATWFGPNIPSSVVPTETVVQFPSVESFNLWTSWTNLENGKGNLTWSQCFMASAILEYDVLISGNSVSLNASQTQWPVVALANNTKPCNDVTKTKSCTIRQLIQATQHIFSAAVLFQLVPGLESGTIDNIIMDQSLLNEFALRHVPYVVDLATSFSSSNPADSIMLNLNELMFRAGVYSAQDSRVDDTLANIDPGLSLSQTVIGTHVNTVNVFHSELKWWAGASVLQILAVLLVAPLFWGWWNLGRDFTFSPFEMAKAFDAPVLREAHSNSGIDDIVARLGKVRVRYGVVRVSDGETEYDAGDMQSDKSLAFHEYHRVDVPRTGSCFGT